MSQQLFVQSKVSASCDRAAVANMMISYLPPVGCIISSGVVLYIYFWILYVSHLALKLFCPLKSAKLFSSDYRRTIYIVEVLILCFIATLPSIVTNSGLAKYKIILFPPTFCLHSDQRYRFYATVVPVSISGCICFILLLFVLYKIHMVCLLAYNVM